MNERTFELMTENEMQERAGLEHESALISRNVPALEESPASLVMPYFAAFRAYERHVARCTACQDTPVWDIGCETGARLAHLSADAMAAQEDLARQN